MVESLKMIFTPFLDSSQNLQEDFLNIKREAKKLDRINVISLVRCTIICEKTGQET